jgi:hypothetical protein
MPAEKRSRGCEPSVGNASWIASVRPERVGRERIAQDDCELVAAEAIQAVRVGDSPIDRCREQLDLLVAGMVSVAVVHRLEVVEVEHDQHRGPGAATRREGLREILVEGAMIQDTGEAVGECGDPESIEVGATSIVQPAAETQRGRRGCREEQSEQEDGESARQRHGLRALGGDQSRARVCSVRRRSSLDGRDRRFEERLEPLCRDPFRTRCVSGVDRVDEAGHRGDESGVRRPDPRRRATIGWLGRPLDGLERGGEVGGCLTEPLLVRRRRREPVLLRQQGLLDDRVARLLIRVPDGRRLTHFGGRRARVPRRHDGDHAEPDQREDDRSDNPDVCSPAHAFGRRRHRARS